MAEEFVRFMQDSTPRAESQPTTQAAVATLTTRPPSSCTRQQLIDQHGDAIGRGLWEIELDARRKTAEKVRALTDRLTELKNQIAAKTAEGGSGLVQLEREMNEAFDVWRQACETYESRRIANQSAIAPLQYEVERILRQIHMPLHMSRLKQWQPAEPGSYPIIARDR